MIIRPNNCDHDDDKLIQDVPSEPSWAILGFLALWSTSANIGHFGRFWDFWTIAFIAIIGIIASVCPGLYSWKQKQAG